MDPRTLVKTLPGNVHGRDFVIGDLHGCMSLLEDRLAVVEFDPQVDRLLSVGDLVDRGADSFGCLRLLSAPWFHAVLGNHEAMLLTYCYARGSDYHRPHHFLHNGGDWLLSLTPEQRASAEEHLIPKLLELPLVLRVQDPRLPYWLVHAERLGRGAQAVVTDEVLSAPQGPRVFDSLYTALTWGRRLAGEALQHVARQEFSMHAGVRATPTPWEPGVGLTYTGHTIFRHHPALHRSHLFIDRGAYMTFTEPHEDGHTLLMVEHREVVSALHERGLLPVA